MMLVTTERAGGGGWGNATPKVSFIRNCSKDSWLHFGNRVGIFHCYHVNVMLQLGWQDLSLDR